MSDLILNKVAIYRDMFGALMEHRIRGYVNGDLAVTKYELR